MRFVLGWIAGASSGFGAALVWMRSRADRELRRLAAVETAAMERWRQQYQLQQDRG